MAPTRPAMRPACPMRPRRASLMRAWLIAAAKPTFPRLGYPRLGYLLLEVDTEIMGEAISCRRLYDLLKAVPDLVSDEEKLIDFESSVSQEEHMEEESGPSVESIWWGSSDEGGYQVKYHNNSTLCIGKHTRLVNDSFTRGSS